MDTARQESGDVAVATTGQGTGRGAAKGRRPAPLTHMPSRYSIIVVWAALILFYSLTSTHFFQLPTFQAIFNSQEHLVFMTMALLCTITIGEFVDLSVPAVFGFAGTIMPVLVVNHGWNVWAGSLAAIAGATAVGAVNAYLIVKMGVNTIVVTLGMSTLLLGLSMLISDDNTISGLPAGFQNFALKNVGGLPISFYYGVVLVLVFAYILAYTPLGRHMRFVGASREVSRLLPVFAAVFLGTAVFEPGRFNPLGTFVGIYFLSTGVIGLQLHSAAVWIEPVFYGAVLVVAVTISTVLHRRTS